MNQPDVNGAPTSSLPVAETQPAPVLVPESPTPVPQPEVIPTVAVETPQTVTTVGPQPELVTPSEAVILPPQALDNDEHHAITPIRNLTEADSARGGFGAVGEGLEALIGSNPKGQR